MWRSPRVARRPALGPGGQIPMTSNPSPVKASRWPLRWRASSESEVATCTRRRPWRLTGEIRSGPDASLWSTLASYLEGFPLGSICDSITSRENQAQKYRIRPWLR